MPGGDPGCHRQVRGVPADLLQVRRTLVRIESPYFVAGIEIGGRAAPVVGYMRGWPIGKVLDYCRRKNWTVVRYGNQPVTMISRQKEGRHAVVAKKAVPGVAC